MPNMEDQSLYLTFPEGGHFWKVLRGVRWELFYWETKSQESFDVLKTPFTKPPHYRDGVRIDIMVKIDTSDIVSHGVLSQYEDNGILHSMVYFSKECTGRMKLRDT